MQKQGAPEILLLTRRTNIFLERERAYTNNKRILLCFNFEDNCCNTSIDVSRIRYSFSIMGLKSQPYSTCRLPFNILLACSQINWKVYFLQDQSVLIPPFFDTAAASTENWINFTNIPWVRFIGNTAFHTYRAIREKKSERMDH